MEIRLCISKKLYRGQLKFKDLTEAWCEDFKTYLLTTKSNKSSKAKLSQNSALSYFNKIKAALKQAYKDGYLQSDLNAKVSPIKQADTERNFLIIEELTALAKTECTIPILKKAALFSALTGLRFSDLKKLTWKEIEFSEGYGYVIRFKQKKTKGNETLPISKQAYGLLGDRMELQDHVFEGLVYSAWLNSHLHRWVTKTGITKDIQFHSFRHTYACLQLSHGTDIYTVSKLMGHKNLSTTQVYAKIIDKMKREAADRIKLDF